MLASPRRLAYEVLCFERSTRLVSGRANTRFFSTSSQAWSGHSKWATIKHDKAKADAHKNKERTLLGRDITNAVKFHGPDANTNPRLALAIQTAKKAGVPKANIEAAIARGQGISASGAALESVTLEAILPPSIAVVIDGQTDNKLRTLADLRLLVKESGGNVTPIAYLFEKKGRIVFQKKEGMDVEQTIETALEADLLDVMDDLEADDEGRLVALTEPTQTKKVAEEASKILQVDIDETKLVYIPNNDTIVELDDEEAAKRISKFLDGLQDIPGIQGVYMNWKKGSISDDLWSELQGKTAI